MRVQRQTLILFLLVAGTTACTTTEVKPWDRGLMAKKAMQINAEPLEAAFDDHIYFSKESSSGGRGFGGGGCGCN